MVGTENLMAKPGVSGRLVPMVHKLLSYSSFMVTASNA
jgi:hypothetical protein